MATQSQDEILYVGFNQDQGCFACGTQRGFKIFNTFPFKDTFKREFDGGIGIVEMLFRCNILALVGGGSHPKFPMNKVLLWDDHQYKCIGELSFKTFVKAVKLRKDKVVVVLESRIYVYNFADLRLIDAIDTCLNPKGLCAISSDPNISVLATPDKTKGSIKVTIYEKNNSFVIAGHQSSLSCMALNFTGSLLATASDKGTLIRLFSTEDGSPLQEVRRGSDKAEIYSISFDRNSNWIACSSDKGTIHIFTVSKTMQRIVLSDENAQHEEDSKKKDEGEVKNKKHMLSFMGGLLPKYFKGEWSYAQFRIGDGRALCGFSEDGQQLIAVTTDGMYHLAEIPKNGGECKEIQRKPITQI